MSFFTLLDHAPLATLVFAGITVLLGSSVLIHGLHAAFTWRRVTREMAALGQALLEDEELKVKATSHDKIYENRVKVAPAITNRSKEFSSTVTVVQQLRVDVDRTAQIAVIGAESSWPGILESFLARYHRPMRRLRAAAGWVVLLGLAGTVFGFSEALPRMRSAFEISQVTEEAQLTFDESTPGTEETASTPLKQSRMEIIRVLGDLGGVFLATLTGVLMAALLHLTASGTSHLSIDSPTRSASSVTAGSCPWYNRPIHNLTKRCAMNLERTLETSAISWPTR